MSKLKEAAELVEKGWTRGVYKSPRVDRPGSADYCALGALYEATGSLNAEGRRIGVQNGPFFRVAFQAIVAAITEQRSWTPRLQEVYGPVNVADWNDRPERTQEEVVAVLKRADELVDQHFGLDK